MATVTSADAARRLFGEYRYPLYLAWFSCIGKLAQAKCYDNYKQWRKAIAASEKITAGDFPSTAIFSYFMQYLNRSDKLFQIEPVGEGCDIPNCRIASRCLHVLHPGDNRENVSLCPVCIMEQNVTSLDRIWDVWTMLGGPFKPSENMKLWIKVKHLWRFEKSRWANTVLLYEEISTKEMEWETFHCSSPEALQKLDSVKSCQEALRIAWTCPYVAEGVYCPFKWTGGRNKALLDEQGTADASMPHGMCHSTSPQELISSQAEEPQPPSASYRNLCSQASPNISSPPSTTVPSSPLGNLSLSPKPPNATPLATRRKCVTFHADTVEHPGRRNAWSYNRKHATYVPGRYASAPDFDKIDTSFSGDSSYDVPDPDQITRESILQGLEAKPSIRENGGCELDDDSESDDSDNSATSTLAVDGADGGFVDELTELRFTESFDEGCSIAGHAGTIESPEDFDVRFPRGSILVHDRISTTQKSTDRCGDGEDGEVLMEEASEIHPALLLEDSVAARRSRAMYEEDPTTSERPSAETKRPRFRGNSRMRQAFEAERQRREMGEVEHGMNGHVLK